MVGRWSELPTRNHSSSTSETAWHPCNPRGPRCGSSWGDEEDSVHVRVCACVQADARASQRSNPLEVNAVEVLHNGRVVNPEEAVIKLHGADLVELHTQSHTHSHPAGHMRACRLPWTGVEARRSRCRAPRPHGAVAVVCL
jgi:hypothetical protein